MGYFLIRLDGRSWEVVSCVLLEFFLFITVTYANRLFTHTRILLAALTAIFGTMAFLSHPETGLQAAAISALLWFFRGHSKRELFWLIGIALGVATLTAPWWVSVWSVHGIAPFQSAMQTSDDGTFHLAQLLNLQFGGGVFFNLTIAFGVVGLLAVLAQNEIFLTYLVDNAIFCRPT